jgi:protein SCO1/2
MAVQQPARPQWLKWLGISFLISLMLTAGFAFYAYQHLQGPKLGGDFTLQSVNGPVSLHDFKGKEVILYFGYTSCPDVCPTSMSRLSKIIHSLPANEQEKVQPIFVSVDTKKDTPKKAQDYVSFFFKGAIGLSGSPQELEKVTHLYGTMYLIENDPKSALGYSVQHPTSFFLIDRNGNYSSSLPTEAPLEALKQEIEALL